MSSTIQNPHDRFFRASMSNPKVAREFIKKHLPAHIAKKIDPDSLKLMPGNFIEDLQEWKTDLLFTVTFEGAPGYIYLLIEHQRKPERLMPLRMLEYTCKIIRTHLQENRDTPLPCIYPIVLYNGIKPYPYTTDFFELFSNPTFARELLLKPFQLIDLTQFPDDDLKEQSLLGIMELLLKYAFARDTLLLIKKIGTLLQKADQMHEIELLRESAEYVFQTRSDDLSKNHILNEFKKHVSTPTQKNIMTIAEAFVEEGRQEGIQTGIQTGIQKGRQEGQNEERKKFRALLHKQLERRFPGQVTSNHLGLLEEADGESLSLWLERLIDAHCIEEVFIW